MFELAASGLKPKEIAQRLNNEKIPTPNEYKALINSGRNWSWASRIGTFWEDKTVLRMLRDQRYIGYAVGNKSERTRVGSPTIRLLNKDSWIIVPNAHKALITKELFDNVQLVLGKASIPQKKSTKAQLFYRKIRCYNCNRSLVRRNGKNPIYKCETPELTNSPNCCGVKMSESIIKETLLSAIQVQAVLFCEAKVILAQKESISANKKDEIEQKIKQLQSDVTRACFVNPSH